MPNARDDAPVLTLAHSPDSDDMVMWWPITGMHDRAGQPLPGPAGRPAIDTGRFRFRTVAEDVQRLNELAIGSGAYDATAISAHAYPHLADRYRITRCGASMGEGYGPKAVVRSTSELERVEDLARPGVRLAVPGRHTTAFLTLQILIGRTVPATEMLFSKIPAAVVSGDADAGLLIHEAQIDFERLGLRPLVDLGQAWTAREQLPLPLGLNVIRRDLDARFGEGTCEEVSALLSASVAHARTHSHESRAFLKLHADTRPEWKDARLLDRYLSMYVSDLTADMGEVGQAALRRLFDLGAGLGLCPAVGEIDLV